ncbi:hypothetical protein [Texcoconibacillus texcoconensis]|uniref:RNA polymerase subunit sigma-70 n=1 Tax=Texcoconibacillus texcoconensis TaxID=1095777 RepID=A0A840QP93_9BACI|nr:hypothetical protein [Texcoconibacillus texcoconensis]MBB5173195.1 hypothetical protein [Texcoconibacillus texcoconensis]
MRTAHQGRRLARSDMNLFGVNLHQFIEKEAVLSNFELAQEFGLALKDVRNLKKQMGRDSISPS